jgi:uncharacterized protein involved in exopolysaccharide biosynthesis
MEEEEVELRDYINVLVKWKRLIIVITLIAILISGLLSYFVLPKVYEGSATIQPAQVSSNLLLSPSDIQTQIESATFIQKLSDDLNVPSDEINKNINVSIPQNSKFVIVNFEHKDKELIRKFFDKLLYELNSVNADEYNNQINSIKSKVLTLSSQIEILNSAITQISKQILQMQKSSSKDELGSYLLTSLYESMLSKKIDLENTVTDLNSQLSMSHEFEYLQQPYVSNTPIKPKKLLNVAIAGVAALFFSILLAFFLEYMEGTQGNKEVSKK